MCVYIHGEVGFMLSLSPLFSETLQLLLLMLKTTPIACSIKQKAEQHMIPLRRLDEFVESSTGSKLPVIQLIKMDTEGSEIDIVRSGLSIFEQNRYVYNPRSQLRRKWTDFKVLDG